MEGETLDKLLQAYCQARRERRHADAEAFFRPMVEQCIPIIFSTLHKQWAEVPFDYIADALQEVWIELLLKRQPLGDRGKELAYLIGMAEHKLQDLLEEEQRQEPKDGDIQANLPAPSPERIAEGRIELAEVLERWPELPPQSQRVLELRALGYSYSDILHVLPEVGSEGNARQIVFRAREVLRDNTEA